MDETFAMVLSMVVIFVLVAMYEVLFVLLFAAIAGL